MQAEALIFSDDFLVDRPRDEALPRGIQQTLLERAAILGDDYRAVQRIKLLAFVGVPSSTMLSIIFWK